MRLATKLATNIIVAGGTIAAAVVLKKLVRFRRGKHATVEDVPDDVGDTVGDMVAVATESGIADVDPQPISHVAGEGIDLDRDVAAHEEITELRARIPR
jgi:hypothetical protein